MAYTSNTNEQALENLIVQALVGPNQSETDLANAPTAYQGSSPTYIQAPAANFEARYGFDVVQLLEFLERTQPRELDKLRLRPDLCEGDKWKTILIERIERKIGQDGLLAILKKGISLDSAHLRLYYPMPYSGLNPLAQQQYAANTFSVARQVHFSVADPSLSIDVVLMVNGLPVVTMELKNLLTGQNTYHARKQYQQRDHKQKLFGFGRCIVHFAVDTEEVYMTTHLQGASTYFLPFNKGNNFGRGNPANPGGIKTAYLWEEILQPKSLSNILEQYAKLPAAAKDKKANTLFFPRYHQLQCVRNLLADVQQRGAGHRYLIQHSAGSGKSFTITWSAFQLMELHDPQGQRNLFDTIIIVTDRRNLDQQLNEDIQLFAEVRGTVAHADSARELRQHLEDGKRIIITTLQKFPFIVQEIEQMAERSFAVIIDEAHSSQSGTAAGRMREALGKGLTPDADQDEAPDLEELVNQAIQARRMTPNVSYLAFTATPKNTTLETFGTRQPDGSFRPFHLYSMKQAIEEGFIMDVLANYTTYRSYYELQKSVEENPLFNTAKAQRQLKAFVEKNPSTIRVKAQTMLEHFRSQVEGPKKLKGQARGMVITANIEAAIQYFMALRALLEERGNPFKVLVAFSGEKEIDGIKYTEQSLNGLEHIEKAFDDDELGYRLLVVANKFLTGFDQPKLNTMYVDKKLQGVLAVQALSRLNRCNHRLGKQDTFILDFFNDVHEIEEAFNPYYTATTLKEATDANVLHDLLQALERTGIYYWEEVEHFYQKLQSKQDPSTLHALLDQAVARFEQLDEDLRIDTKIKVRQFVKIYGQVCCILPFDVPKWELLYWYLKFLLPKLHIPKDDGDISELLESVVLDSYVLEQKQVSAQVALDEDETELDPPSNNPRSLHKEETEDELDKIISDFNDRYFKGWDASPEEKRTRIELIARKVQENTKYESQVAKSNDPENAHKALGNILKKVLFEQRKQEDDFYRKFLSDKDFNASLLAAVQHVIGVGGRM